MRESKGQPVHGFEVLSLCIAAAAIIASCVVDSQRRLFWGDEVATALAVSDESFSHMLTALKDEFNAMPPLYFVVGWIWVRIFGASELSLRLPAAFFVVVGIVAIWAALRRFMSRWPATYCAIVLPLLVGTIRYHICEARCYALYFAAYAIAVALYLHCTGRHDRSLLFYISVVLVHGVLVGVHYVGGLFSALIVIAALLSWKFDGDVRFFRYGLSALLGWIAVIPAVPFLLAQRKISTQHSFIADTQIGDLIGLIGGGDIAHFHLIATFMLLGWLVAEWIDDSDVYERVAWRPGREAGHVAVLMAVTIAFLPAVWLESRWGARIFISRYLFPASVAWVVAIGFVYGGLFEKLWGLRKQPVSQPLSGSVSPSLRERWLRVTGRSLVCVTAAVLAIGMLAMLARGRPTNVSAELERDLAAARQHPGCPVLTRSGGNFLCLAYYLRLGNRVFLLTDEWSAEPPLKRHGSDVLERLYFPDSMRKLPEFLGEHDRFLIVDPTGALLQFLAQAPAWEGKEITDRVWLWQRRQ